MKVVNGEYSSATIFTDNIEEHALAQIQQICDNPVAKGSRIKVMPDVHPGKVGTIGLTMTIGERVLPNLVGIDIGCGMSVAKLRQKKIEYQKLDTVIREYIPSGFAVREKTHRFGETFPFEELNCYEKLNIGKAVLSMGTLGSGNHFIEIDKGAEDDRYAVIHSGSRSLGKEVTEYYLHQGQLMLKEQGKDIPYELTYLEGELLEGYLHDMQVVQRYAAQNRAAMLDELNKRMKWKMEEVFSCIHNYIEAGAQDSMLRKGAISAKNGENVVIPINMRDGIILGKGKGNMDWNCSAPHGAGRIMKREDVKQRYTVSDYKKAMKGIYSSSVGKGTLDEAPFAYRGLEEICNSIKETVDITEIIRPVYNFKAETKEKR